MFDRDVYWASLWNDSGAKESIVFDYPYAKAQLLGATELASLRRLTFELVARTLNPESPPEAETPQGQQRILETLNDTTSFSMVKDLDLMTQLDALLMKIFREGGLLQGIQGMQFPVNVRVSHPSAPPGYAEGDYSTDHIHCDPWTGAPTDMINCLIFIDVDSNSSGFELLVVDKDRIDMLSRFKGHYGDALPMVSDLAPICYKEQTGQLIVFDTFTPHRTIRRGSAIRLSMDLRLRRQDPYAVLDERWDQGAGGWDYYWYPNLSGATTFSDRCDDELKLLSQKGSKAAVARRIASIEKLKRQPYTPTS